MSRELSTGRAPSAVVALVGTVYGLALLGAGYLSGAIALSGDTHRFARVGAGAFALVFGMMFVSVIVAGALALLGRPAAGAKLFHLYLVATLLVLFECLLAWDVVRRGDPGSLAGALMLGWLLYLAFKAIGRLKAKASGVPGKT